jgi:hypothetical protein
MDSYVYYAVLFPPSNNRDKLGHITFQGGEQPKMALLSPQCIFPPAPAEAREQLHVEVLMGEKVRLYSGKHIKYMQHAFA